MITGKKLLTLLVLSVLLIGTLVACSLDRGGTTGSTSATGGSSGVEVHMKGVEFIPNSITIKKGQSIKLIDDDTFTSHIISNGTWENNQEKSEREPNAPTVDHMQISGGSTGSVGPFNAAGTFKLYCTIHAGMKLIIIVQAAHICTFHIGMYLVIIYSTISAKRRHSSAFPVPYPIITCMYTAGGEQ